jgi:prepilin-type N-terminal cleavage/methylation domain-containing protein
MKLNKLTDIKGFTLIELIISLAIVGVLAATSVPVMRAYVLKARQLELELTIKHLMDGMETHYLDTNEMYPPLKSNFIETLTIERGQGKIIKELSYTFPAGHRHKYVFYNMDLSSLIPSYPHMVYIYICADFDYDRDGVNDFYIIYMCLENNRPMEGNYRIYKQFKSLPPSFCENL